MGLTGDGPNVNQNLSPRGHHIELRLPGDRGPKNGGRYTWKAKKFILPVPVDLLFFDLSHPANNLHHCRDGIKPREWHTPVTHLPPRCDPRPECSLLTDTDLVILRFTDDGPIHPGNMASVDHVLDALHEPFFIHRDGQYDPSPHRSSRFLDRLHGEHGGCQVPFGVARTAAIDAIADDLTREGRMGPISLIPFGDDVRMGLEENGPSHTATECCQDIRPSRFNLFYQHVQSRLLKLLTHKPGDLFFPLPGLRPVDTGNTDQVTGQLNEFRRLNTVEDIIESHGSALSIAEIADLGEIVTHNETLDQKDHNAIIRRHLGRVKPNIRSQKDPWDALDLSTQNTYKLVSKSNQNASSF